MNFNSFSSFDMLMFCNMCTVLLALFTLVTALTLSMSVCVYKLFYIYSNVLTLISAGRKKILEVQNTNKHNKVN